MVNVTKGVLVKCDGSMKQLLLHFDKSLALGRNFIIQDLDEAHLFISSDIVDALQDHIDEFMDTVHFNLQETQSS